MADGIYYNQEVTADMLNGIAQDLGHTSFSGFGTEKFGADELNKITAELVTKGVLIKSNADNEANERNECKIVKSSSGEIILSEGIIVFENGAKKTISEPLIIDADNSTVIYAYNNVAAGICTIEVAESYPTGGDYVKLASVNADGTITDNREFAVVKALADGTFENKYHDFSIYHPRFAGKYENADSNTQTVYTMPHNGFRYLLLRDADLGDIRYYPLEHIIDLNIEGKQYIYLNDSGISTMLYAEKNGNELTITSVSANVNYPHTFYLTLA